MVSLFEHVASQVPTTNIAPAGLVQVLWTRAARSLRSAMCGLQGHDALLQVNHGRMFLKCMSCGHETPGWTMNDRRPRQRFTGDHARHRLN